MPDLTDEQIEAFLTEIETGFRELSTNIEVNIVVQIIRQLQKKIEERQADKIFCLMHHDIRPAR